MNGFCGCAASRKNRSQKPHAFKNRKHGPPDGDDETRTRDLCRDSERFISTCNDLQEHGRHPKSLQDSLRHRYCVPRCVPRLVLPKIVNLDIGGERVAVAGPPGVLDRIKSAPIVVGKCCPHVTRQRRNRISPDTKRMGQRKLLGVRHEN